MTTPPAEILAVAGVPLDHNPPVVTSFKVIVDPKQTSAGPVITAGTGFTVTAVVLKQPVPGMV